MSKEVAEVLRKARALIDTSEHWWHGASGPLANGKRCSLMALTDATSAIYGGDDAAERVWEKAKASLGRHAWGWMHIALWNDAPERTHAEVLAAFDAAIAAEEASP